MNKYLDFCDVLNYLYKKNVKFSKVSLNDC